MFVTIKITSRWIKRYHEIKNQQKNIDQIILKKHGVYLITGGAGGLGTYYCTVSY